MCGPGILAFGRFACQLPPEDVVELLILAWAWGNLLRACGEVLPAGIGEHEHHRRTLEALGPLEGRVQDGPRRRADEDALAPEDFVHRAERAPAPNEDLAVQLCEVE